MIKKRRLFFDIETSPNVGLFWSAGWKQTIGTENILKERAIICICYKWAGEKKVYSLTWDNKQSDKAMLKKFVKIANSADELVGHNGDRYDLAWIRTRCLFHQIDCFPNYTTIDTLKISRSKFRFNSNRLDYIGKFLGIGGKMSTGGFQLWKNIVLNKCEKSLDKMVRYCKVDVVRLEQIFDRLSSHIPAKVHHGMLKGSRKIDCPDCGSSKMQKVKTRLTAAGTKRIQLQCQSCGKFHTVPEKSLQK